MKPLFLAVAAVAVCCAVNLGLAALVLAAWRPVAGLILGVVAMIALAVRYHRRREADAHSC